LAYPSCLARWVTVPIYRAKGTIHIVRLMGGLHGKA
jgi:hypothetical protein